MRGLMAIVVSCCVVPLLHAQEPGQVFSAGNGLYEAGRYDSALVVYQSVLRAGYESAELYYNLGNTYFKMGALGRAAANFERAIRLRPGDPDARANLELVANLAVDDITPLRGFWPLRAWRWWLNLFPPAMLGWLAAIGYVAAGVAGVGVILGRGTGARLWSQRVALIGAAAAVLFGGTLLAGQWRAARSIEAVVIPEEVVVRSAPVDDPSLDIFTIHEATKVRIDNRSESWVEIVLLDGQVGWVPAEAVEII